MKVVIDAEILNQFFSSRPPDKSFDNEQDLEDWLSFKRFIKSESSLTILNKDLIQSDLLKCFTDGRGDSELDFTSRKLNIYKGKIPKGYPSSTFFCIKETDCNKRKDIIQSNNFLVGFEDNYLNKWLDLSFRRKGTTFHVDKGNEHSMKSWDILSNSILPFNYIIICDRYILEADGQLILALGGQGPQLFQ